MNRLTSTGAKFLTPMQATKEELIEEIKRHQKYYDRLAAYEDTGLEPKDILTATELSNINAALEKANSLLDELVEYKDLEKQGKLYKIPCKVGNTVYKLEDYGEWQDNLHTFIPIKCQVELIFLGDDNKVYCDLVSIDDLFQVGDKFEEIPINEIYLSKEAAEKASEGIK